MPRHARGLIDRARLMKRLQAQQDARLTLLHAPAGYGKSILMQQWAQWLTEHGTQTAWFSVEPTDLEPSAFLDCLVQAFEEASISIAPRVKRTLTHEKYYSWKVLIKALANHLLGTHERCVLCIDDAHHLRNSEALGCLEMLLEAAPPNFHIVMATRENVGLPLGRARALGQVFELGADDLRFLAEEAALLLETEGHANLSDKQLRLLQERTEGWIVGIKLLSLSLHNDPDPDHTRLLDQPSGERRHIADFFAEDVVARQTPELRSFLLRTSILDRFCARLCDRVLQITDSQRLIDDCERTGLFIVPLDQTRTWYRYHHLFSEYLTRELNDLLPGERNRVLLAAADWLVETGYYIEGFEYAMRGSNPLRAAEILELSCDAMWRAGQQECFQRLAARIPQPIQSLHPRIMLAVAWRLCMQWHVSEARNLLSVSQARLQEMELSGNCSPEELRRLKCLIQHREGQLAHTTYDIETLHRKCMALETEIQHLDDPYILASFYNSRQFAEREQYNLTRIDRLSELARTAIANAEVQYNVVFHAAISGPSYLIAGRTEKALAILAHGLQVAEELAGRASPLGAVAAIPLSQVHYERNETQLATDLLERYLPANTIGFVDQLVIGASLQARLLSLSGDRTGALRALANATSFAIEHDLSRLEISATVEQVILLLRSGYPEDATKLARASGLYKPKYVEAQHNKGVTRLDGSIATMWCRISAANDRVADALRVARMWRGIVANAHAVYDLVRWDLLIAQLLLLSGDRLAAQRSLSQAIAKAAEPGLLRAFLDEGEPIAQLLMQISSAQRRVPDPNERFVQQLTGAFARELNLRPALDDDSHRAAGTCGKMSAREIQILELAATGMPNQQIGTKLGLTEGSVKWYLQQIYDKVGVRDRFLAAQRARQFGLMT
jgi:LuxR family maltose regulon positive regulatory protein